jgi:hypothetical protein
MHLLLNIEIQTNKLDIYEQNISGMVNKAKSRQSLYQLVTKYKESKGIGCLNATQF